MSAPWQMPVPEAAPSSGGGWRVAAMVIGLVLLAMVMVGALLATRSGSGGLGTADPRALPGEYTAGPMTLTDVVVREDSADDFEVSATVRYDDWEALDADLEVDILDDEQVIGSGSATVYFSGAGSHEATFLSYDDYDEDFDQVIFRLPDPLTAGLADVRPVAGTFASGDFTLTDVRVGEDTVGDFEVRGTVTYDGAEAVEADLAVDIGGPAGELGRASTTQAFEPGQSLSVDFITTADHTDDTVVLTFEAAVDEEVTVPPSQVPTVVTLPGDRVVDGVTFTSIRLVRDYDGNLVVDAVAAAAEGSSPYDGDIQAQVLRGGEVVATVTGYTTLVPGQATTVYLSGTDDFAEPLDDIRFTLFRG